MNSKAFAQVFLLLLSFIFIGFAAYFIVHNSLGNQPSPQTPIDISWNSFAIYSIIPYGILIIYLLIWSRDKTFEDIKETLGVAPLFLMLLVGATDLLIALFVAAMGEGVLHEGDGAVFMVVTLISIPASLIGGYAFIGISFLIYKFFKGVGVIRD